MKNAKKYRQLSEPHQSADAVNAAFERFYAAISEARDHYKIRDVVVVVMDSHEGDGDETEVINLMEWGDATKHEAMAAWAMGFLGAERQRVISNAMKAAGAVMAGRRDA